MQATGTPTLSPPRWTIGVAVVAVSVLLGSAVFLLTRDSSVTRWHIPYRVLRDGVSYPLYDKTHCYRRSAVAPIHRVGTAAGLPLYASPGADPESYYVQPNGQACFMKYLSLSNVG